MVLEEPPSIEECLIEHEVRCECELSLLGEGTVSDRKA